MEKKLKKVFPQALDIRPALILFLIFAVVLYPSPVSAGPGIVLNTIKEEPVVRIGVVLKAKEATVSLAGGYEIIDKSSNTSLATGGGGTFKVTLVPAAAPGVPGNQYRVTVGSFKSFEEASFAAERLAPMDLPMRIAYPDSWYLWFGPFASTEDARTVLFKLRSLGYSNSNIEPVPMGTSGFTVKGASGEVVFTGTGPVVFQSAAGKVTVQDSVYRGDVEVLPDSTGSMSVVNLVRADDYLRGVIPQEMPAAAHSEALKAQAIIARTYLLNNRHRHREDGFELCNTSDCQVYGGVKGEADSTNAAVVSTKGMVVAYNDRLANALFHSTCGGRTSNYSDMWASEYIPPYLASVNDGMPSKFKSLKSEDVFLEFLNDTSGNCTKSKYYRWEMKVEKSEIQSLLEETIPKFLNDPGLSIGEVLDIKIAARGDSGRVLKIAISTSTGEYVFERDTIRWVLGKLKSTLFAIQKTTDANGLEYYVFRGAGWGHGAGMCQMGAMKLARDGVSYKDIILMYYPGTKIAQLWK